MLPAQSQQALCAFRSLVTLMMRSFFEERDLPGSYPAQTLLRWLLQNMILFNLFENFSVADEDVGSFVTTRYSPVV